MVMFLEDKTVKIVYVDGHYEGHVDGKFVVSGDTRYEVYQDLEEMGFIK